MREIKFRVWYSDRKSSFYIYGSQALRLMGYFGQEGYSFEQYTGIKDKNGVDIYENDIVKVILQYWGQLGNKYVVTFESGAFLVPTATLYDIKGSVEVIGNIHDNPDLLNDTNRISPDDIGNDIHEFLHGGDK